MNDANRTPAGRLGMRFFLLSLSMLFAASIVGFLVVRAKAPTWPPEGAPPLPSGLWLSTALILLSSWTFSKAFREVAGGDQQGAFRWLVGTVLLSLVFVANQILNWIALWPALYARATALYVFSFLLLTVLHALHVVGGLVSLGVVTAKAKRATVTTQTMAYAGMYWHFLTIVWLVLFLVLMLLF